MLSQEEWAAEFQKLTREREALELSFGDLNTRFMELAAGAKAGTQPEPSPELAAVVAQLLTLLEMEREHVQALWRLLGDALERNAQA